METPETETAARSRKGCNRLAWFDTQPFEAKFERFMEPSRKQKLEHATDVPRDKLYRQEEDRACDLSSLYQRIQKRFDSHEGEKRSTQLDDCTYLHHRPSDLPALSQLEKEKEFKTRADRWRMETSFQSSLVAKFMHDDYQTIMAMGPSVIPLILNRLKTAHEHWFWALKHLAKEDIAEGTDNPVDATRLWLKWGKRSGYID